MKTSPMVNLMPTQIQSISLTSLCALGVGLLLVAALNIPTHAHHAFGAEFDPNRPVSVSYTHLTLPTILLV